MNLEGQRAVLTILILIVGFAGVLAPRCSRSADSPVLMYLNLFSAGVLMAAALVHLLSESSHDLEASPLAQNAEGEVYPWNFFFAVLTFYVMFFFERILLKCVAISEFSKLNQGDTADQVNHAQTAQNIVVTTEDDGVAGDVDTVSNVGHVVHDGHLTDLVEQGNFVGAFILMAGLSLHSILEGLALGDAQNTNELTTLVIAILSHKLLAAIALGTPFKNANVSLQSHIAFAFLFSIMTPIGALIGWGVGSQMDPWVGSILVSMAAGTFMYVSIMEIMVPQFGAHNHGEIWAKTMENVHDVPSDEIKEELYKSLAVLVGFGAMSVLGIWA